MAHYRKIDARIWNDEKFATLSERGKLVFLFLLTHPNLTMLGAMRGSIPGLASELFSRHTGPQALLEGFSEAFAKEYVECFREVSRKGLARYDEKACLIWLPNFIRYNRPESPNVVKSWPAAFDLLPECSLKYQLFERLKGSLEGFGEGFRHAFTKAFAKTLAKTMPNQEQEQEQELNTIAERQSSPQKPAKTSGEAVIQLPTNKPGEVYGVTPEQIAEWSPLYPAVDVLAELRKAVGWLDGNAKNRKSFQGMKRFIHHWLRQAQDRAPRIPTIPAATKKATLSASERMRMAE